MRAARHRRAGSAAGAVSGLHLAPNHDPGAVRRCHDMAPAEEGRMANLERRVEALEAKIGVDDGRPVLVREYADEDEGTVERIRIGRNGWVVEHTFERE